MVGTDSVPVFRNDELFLESGNIVPFMNSFSIWYNKAWENNFPKIQDISELNLTKTKMILDNVVYE